MENHDAWVENLERLLDVLETSLNSGKPQGKLSRAWLHTTTQHQHSWQHSHRHSTATSQEKDLRLTEEAEEMLCLLNQGLLKELVEARLGAAVASAERKATRAKAAASNILRHTATTTINAPSCLVIA